MQLHEPIDLTAYDDPENPALPEYIKSRGDFQKFANKLSPIYPVSKFWPQQPSEHDLHVLVTLPIGKFA